MEQLKLISTSSVSFYFIFSLIAILVAILTVNPSGAITFEDETQNAVVAIPMGSANPELDITNLGPRQWYLPQQMVVDFNSTITWINNDTEMHTVTSGTGSGIESLVNNKRGNPDGLFDSGFFKPGKSWSHLFNKTGSYPYFCTIHPWMEGKIIVSSKADVIPNYAVDATGKKIDKMPLYYFTDDGKMEVGLSWDPNVLLTGKQISFFVSFFDSANNRPNLLPFDFVLIQDGKQIEHIQSLARMGIDVQHFVFGNSGPLTIQLENIGGQKTWNVQFNSTVYRNPNTTLAAEELAKYQSSNDQSDGIFKVNTLTLVYLVYAIIIGIPAAAGITLILYKKGKI